MSRLIRDLGPEMDFHFIMSFKTRKRHSYAHEQKSAQSVRKNTGLKSDGDAASNASKGSSTRSKRTSRKLNPLYVAIRKYKTIWSSFDESMQDVKSKRTALNLAVRLCPKYYGDSFRFWQDLLDEANILLDSKRFETACKAKGLSAQAVAEHLVCEGKATVNLVLKNGLDFYGEKAQMFSERLYEDKRNLYNAGDKAKTTEASSAPEVEQLS